MTSRRQFLVSSAAALGLATPLASATRAATEPNVDAITIDVDTRASRPLHRELLGCNVEFMRRCYGYRTPQVIALTRDLRLGLLRYPDGGESNHWDWEAANFMPPEVLTAMREAQQKSGFTPEGGHTIQSDRENVLRYHPDKAMGVDSFMAFCGQMQQPHPQPLWVANLLTGTPEKNAAWVAYNKRKGYANTLWELGNEHYLRGSHYKYPSAAEYLRDAQQHTRAMKAADSSVRVSVTASELHRLGSYQGEQLAGPDSFVHQWNTDLAKGGFYDAISVHDYFPITEQDVRSSEDAVYRLMMARAAAQFPLTVGYYQELFGAKVRIWLSEWNVLPFYQRAKRQAGQSRAAYPIVGSLAHCLYISDWLLHATDYSENIELSGLHVLAAPFPRGLFRAQLPEEQNLEKPFVTTPPYQAVRLLGIAWLGANATAAPRLGGVESMTGALGLAAKDVPAVTARAFLREGRLASLAIINKSGRSRSLVVSMDGRALSGDVQVTTLTGPARIEGYGSSDIVETRFVPQCSVATERKPANRLALPAYSLTVITRNNASV